MTFETLTKNGEFVKEHDSYDEADSYAEEIGGMVLDTEKMEVVKDHS